MIKFGVGRITFGLPCSVSFGLPSTGMVSYKKDELITALNAIAAFVGLTKDSDRFISAVLAVLKGEGINLVWDAKEKKFKRAP